MKRRQAVGCRSFRIALGLRARFTPFPERRIRLGVRFNRLPLDLLLDLMYPMGYFGFLMTVRETETFRLWIRNLRDGRAQARINMRIRRLSLGNHGDSRSVGDGVMELRIDYGPGYRGITP